MLLLAQAQLFDLGHSLYMGISVLVSALILILSYIFVKKQSYKEGLLKFWAIITVAIHYSIMWVQYLKNETVEVGGNLLFPLFACNACMWMLVAVAFIKNKECLAFRLLAEFVFWGGIVCGIVGILLNDNYIGSAGLSSYAIFKGLLSHSTMLIGAIYLLVGGFIKIRVFNVLSVAFGLAIFLVDGLIMNAIYSACGLGEANSMYLQAPPFENMPWLNTAFIGIVALTVCFVITAIYEHFALNPSERWYSKIKLCIENKRRAKEK